MLSGGSQATGHPSGGARQGPAQCGRATDSRRCKGGSVRPVAALAAALCCGLLGAPAALAETDEPPACTAPAVVPQVPDGLVDDLLDWIAGATGYDLARTTPPTVEFCLPGSLVPYEGTEMLVQPNLRGAYDVQARRIWLALPWSADRPHDVSVLLHELVHHVQFANRGWPCPQAAEWEAYRLQADWLGAHGLAHGFDWFAIWLLSRCPSGVHP